MMELARSDELRLDDQLCFALYAATTMITRAYRPLLRQIGITYPQYLTLMVLWQSGDCSIGNIAQSLNLPGHAITPIVDRLQAVGLVKRRRDQHDGRAVLVGLTPAGVDLEQAAGRVQHTVACQTGLTTQALARLRTELHELVQHMSDTSAQSAQIEGEAS